MNTAKKELAKEFTQFEVTTDLLRNLYKFNLTPVAKLVLLELTTHLNESKNGSVVFPSIGYIAEVLGVGLTAAKKAINDLIKEGLIIKSKRDKVTGNRNKYLITPKVQNSTSERAENELFKQSENDLFLLEQIKETKKEQRGIKKMGGNVYNESVKQFGTKALSEEDCILRDYAIKHGARNIQAYVKKLKETKSAKNITKEYQKKSPYKTYEQTLKLLQMYKEYQKDTGSPKECSAWVQLGKRLKNDVI